MRTLKAAFLGIIAMLLLTGILPSALNPRLVASGTFHGTVYIRPDGSIDPPDAPIFTADNVTYVLTGNIMSDKDGIVVQRDNIVIDGRGYTVKGMHEGRGVGLAWRVNVTVKNVRVESFWRGITLHRSNNNITSGNSVTDNDWYGIGLSHSSNNSVTGNNVTGNKYGIGLHYSHNNSISGNDVTGNGGGIWLWDSSNNSVTGNNVTRNLGGIGLFYSSNNIMFHNNFIENARQVYTYKSVNVWDGGYPYGGNYWSDYKGVDEKSGPGQDRPGSDGIGDTPYVIDVYNKDRYPLMKPLVWGIAIANVTLDKTVVGHGYAVEISVTAVNRGRRRETFDLTIYVNATAIMTKSLTLDSLGSTTLTFTWNTTGFAYGRYILTANVTAVPGEVDLGDNTFIRVVTVTIPGDVMRDFDVDIYDVVTIVAYFNLRRGDPKYISNYDVNCDGKIDIHDVVVACANYGKRL